MIKNKIYKILTLLFFTSSVGYAQTTINVSSHSAEINGIVHDYSIGEMTMVSTEHSASLIVTQGLLQPQSLISATAPTTTTSNLIDFVKVYPNPTNSILNIELNEIDNVHFQLFDALGKLVYEEKNSNKTTQLNLSNYANGNYYLLVQTNNENNQKLSFKIQKIN